MEGNGQFHALGKQPSVPIVDPGIGLDAMEKENSTCLCRESNRNSSVVQPLAQSLYRQSYSTSNFEYNFEMCNFCPKYI
jgi:hypothetical protein